RTPVSRVW
ncbi:hypothetical protein D030_4063B, partial [Vibrio parahaemolyticus AQ3810]